MCIYVLYICTCATNINMFSCKYAEGAKTLEAATHFIDPKTCIDQQYIGHNVDLKRQYLVSEDI